MQGRVKLPHLFSSIKFTTPATWVLSSSHRYYWILLLLNPNIGILVILSNECILPSEDSINLLMLNKDEEGNALRHTLHLLIDQPQRFTVKSSKNDTQKSTDTCHHRLLEKFSATITPSIFNLQQNMTNHNSGFLLSPGASVIQLRKQATLERWCQLGAGRKHHHTLNTSFWRWREMILYVVI